MSPVSRVTPQASSPVSTIDALWARLRHAAAQPALWLDLARLYAGQVLPWQAGYAARQALRLDAGLLPALQALEGAAGLPAGWQSSAGGDALLGRAALPEAASLAQRFHEGLKACPGDWLSWLYLARLQDMAPEAAGLPPAGQALQQARALEPIDGESLHWMGVWRLNAGDAPGAVAALSGLLDVRPMRFGSMMYLGEALLRVGNTAAAETAFARASLSNNPDFLQGLAAKVYGHNYWREAIDVLKKALGLRPQSVPLWLALARIQSEVYDLAACRESLQRLQALAPDHPEVRMLGAGLQGRMGDARGHLQTLQAAYAAGGDPLSRIASSIAMTSLYHDELSGAEVAELHRRLCAPIEAAFTPQTDFPQALAGGPRLRLGLVTGDLHRQHPVNLFMLPVLLRFDRSRLEVSVYHTGTMHDAYTRRAQGCVDRWVEAAGLDDTALQQTIVADGVQVLLDLAGHTSSHRLGVFALRAAPVQATFLGYPHSTGLSTIDWLVGDATVSPAGHAHLFSEGIAQLPGSVFCWASLDDYPLPPPRPAAAPLVFGSFNNAMKLSPRTIALWARVLAAVPGSRLLLKAPSLGDATVQARFTDLFAAQGVAPQRLMFQGPSGLEAMMQAYGDVDIALDTLPYNGGTTTLQALWMGVPVVTLAGDNFVSRMGASFLHSLGRPEWVAADEAAYVAAAVALAGDSGALRLGRARLRARMAASPLCDIQAYVAHFEELLRRMWAAYRAGKGQRLIPASLIPASQPSTSGHAHP